MARAVYQYELSDADFTWLLNCFQENHPEYMSLQSSSLPIVFLKMDEAYAASHPPVGEMIPPPATDEFEEDMFPFSGKK